MMKVHSYANVQDKYIRHSRKDNEEDLLLQVPEDTEETDKTDELNRADEFTASDELKRLQDQLELARKQTEGAAEGWKTFIKCLKIAMPIMSGDTVPKQDHRYLAKHDPGLYTKAISMKVEKTDPKKLKRISEDEEDKTEEEYEKNDVSNEDSGESGDIETESIEIIDVEAESGS